MARIDTQTKSDIYRFIKFGYFKTLEQCEKALRDLGSSVALEMNPQNPLDCELKGQVESMARMVWGSLKYYPIFAGAILGFGWLFIFIAENGQ
jgi:hypothetical protein